MAKRLNNESTIADVLYEIIQKNRLQGGIDNVAVSDAWKNLMGKGVNTYTKNIVLKGNILYVELTSAVLRQELQYGKDKIIAMINNELGREVLKEVVLR